MTTTATYNSQQSSNKGFILGIVAICIVGALGVALVATRGIGNDPDSVAQTAPVEIEGDYLPSMVNAAGVTDATNDPAIGLTAPTLRGTNFNGESVVIEPDGRAKVVYFLAHWCPHCQSEVPVVQGLIDDGQKPENVDIYTVSTSVTSARGNHPPMRWLDREGWTSPVIRDDDASGALISYGAGGFPFAVYLDGDNTVLARSSGALSHTGVLQAWQLTSQATAPVG